jgi:hypothetical protein
MRRLISGMTSAVIASALALVLGGAPHAAQAADATAAQAPAAADAAAPKDDYYTRRARTVLEAEKNAVLKPHPLAAKYPGKEIVVCEAGCPQGSGAYVVSVRSEAAVAAARQETREAMMVPTSATVDRGAATSAPPRSSTLVACVAGCYGASDAGTAPLSPRNVGAWRTTIMPEIGPRPQRDKFSPIR